MKIFKLHNCVLNDGTDDEYGWDEYFSTEEKLVKAIEEKKKEILKDYPNLTKVEKNKMMKEFEEEELDWEVVEVE